MTFEIKKIWTLTGIPLRPLVIGSRAVIVHQGKITRTAPIVAIHRRTAGEVHFETLDTRYYLLTGSDFEPAMSSLPAALAA